MDEAPGWPIVRKLGQANNRDGSLFQRLMPTMVVQVGRSIPGTGRVDLDRGLAQIIGQVDGEHIERCLRGVIGKNLGVVVRSVRIAINGDRTQAARIFTIRALFAARSRGNNGCVNATVPKKGVSKVLRSVSMVTSLACPSPFSKIPALFTSTWRCPNSEPICFASCVAL